MSAEVVFNEVWTEDCGTLFSSSFFLSFFPPSISPPSQLPASDRNRQTERQRHTAGSILAGVGEKAMVELIGENGSPPPPPHNPPYLPIHHHVITARAPLTACERHFKDFLPGWCTGVGCFSEYACRNVCVQRSRSLHAFVWSEAGQAGCVVSPGAETAFPLIIAYHRIIILLLNTCQLY